MGIRSYPLKSSGRTRWKYWPLLVAGRINYIVDIVATKLQLSCLNTVMTLSFWTARFGQRVQTQIRLLLNAQSDQGLHCFLLHLRLFDIIS